MDNKKVRAVTDSKQKSNSLTLALSLKKLPKGK